MSNHARMEIHKLILAGYPLLNVVTDDERPLVEAVNQIAKNCPTNYKVFTWNSSHGFIPEIRDPNPHTSSNTHVMAAHVAAHISKHLGDAIFILHDFHLFLKDNNQGILNLKDAVLSIKEPFTSKYELNRYRLNSKRYEKHIIITAPDAHIPVELNKLMNLVYFGLPRREEISTILDDIIKTSSLNKRIGKDKRDQIINASLGLTETEILNAYAYSMIADNGYINPLTVVKQKKQIIDKSGILEYEEPDINLDDVGGLRQLMDWVKKRKIAYDEQTREEYQLDYPKGVLLTGVQGCGKSFSAKAIAAYLQVPFLKLDMGSIMNMWVGESESNIRKALNLAESIAPSVLFIDEIEKGISDPSSGSTHEVSNRILSTLLTWLQEKKSPVFVIATSNNLERLPPELMRKGRFDEIFFIDLPDNESKQDIFELKLKAKKQYPQEFDLNALVNAADGFSGSEIESVVNESMFEAAYAKTKVTTDIILDEINKTSPLSKTMADKVSKIRDWAKKQNIRPAD